MSGAASEPGLKLPIARPKGTVVSMWTNHMTQHRRSALYGSGIMEAYFLLILNTHSSFQSCNRRSTIDAHRSPQQHSFLKKIEKICIVQIKLFNFHVTRYNTQFILLYLENFCSLIC